MSTLLGAKWDSADPPAGIAKAARAPPVRRSCVAARAIAKVGKATHQFREGMRYRGGCAGLLLCAVLHEMRGSIVGTRKDLAEAIEFASEAKLTCIKTPSRISATFRDLKAGKVDGGIVIKFRRAS
jgi:hypothetical protein